ncbi:hypothetical protein ONZ45_g14846 [Pleurotus djamor]|nr:hypothetical protein ONZ45_g14846 [Pleurotus djamor]
MFPQILSKGPPAQGTRRSKSVPADISTVSAKPDDRKDEIGLRPDSLLKISSSKLVACPVGQFASVQLRPTPNHLTPGEFAMPSLHEAAILRAPALPLTHQPVTQPPVPPQQKGSLSEDVTTVPGGSTHARDAHFPRSSGVFVTDADLPRLREGGLLNDTLIEFGLNLWCRELQDINPSLAADVHVFSPFFYSKLNVLEPRL